MNHRFSYLLIKALLFIPGLFPRISIRVLPRIAHFILATVIGYRKEVIHKNLSRCFKEEDVKKISKDYYKHLSKILIEPFFTSNLSRDYLLSRVYGDYSNIKQVAERKQNAIILLGHMGNWEWLSTVSCLYIDDFQVVCIYKRMSNKYIEDFVNQAREKYNTICVEMKELPRFLVKSKSFDKPIALCFIADQIPSHNNVAIENFFGQDMYFFDGYSKIAKRLKASVFYLESYVKENDYIYNTLLLHDFEKEANYDELTKDYVCALQENIIKQPFNWLWSHKRWKRLPS